MDLLKEIVGTKKSNFEKRIEENIKKARESFWEYCKLTNPDFYFERREFLKDYCNILQDLYERKL